MAYETIPLILGARVVSSILPLKTIMDEHLTLTSTFAFIISRRWSARYVTAIMKINVVLSLTLAMYCDPDF